MRSNNTPEISILRNLFFGIFTLILAVPTVVYADPYGTGAAADAAGLKKSGDLSGLIGGVIGQALTFVGVLFFILMLYGGILWMLARGNEDYSRKALSTITAAIIGLIIVVGSYAITQFVFNAAAGNSNDPTPTAAQAGTASCVDHPNKPATSNFVCSGLSPQGPCDAAVDAAGNRLCLWQ